jgi:hypothetical protein
LTAKPSNPSIVPPELREGRHTVPPFHFLDFL